MNDLVLSGRDRRQQDFEETLDVMERSELGHRYRQEVANAKELIVKLEHFVTKAEDMVKTEVFDQ